MKHPQRSRKARAADARRSFAGLVQPDSSGRVEGGFFCAACDGVRTLIGGAFAAYPFPPLAVCQPCVTRGRNCPAFRQRAEGRIREFAPKEFARHMAEHLRRPFEILVQVFSASDNPALWDAALGLPAGSSDAAIAQISAMGAVPACPFPQPVRDADRELAPVSGIAPQLLAESLLNHPGFEQLMAEALAMHRRDIRATRRH